ncbi:MFS transporter [Brevundimonas diminuta]|uniref:MFS transporter n=1 Tax=Brevundimonas diminuta TaxID=293 RepID=UPI0037C95DB5
MSNPEPAPLAKGAWYTLIILTLVYVSNSIDRTVMSILIEPVKAEFQLSDSQLGVLTGLAFGLTYALAGLPMGWLIDRVNRTRLLAVVVAIWSVCTSICGFAQNYPALVMARLAVGASESAAAPTAMSMIADLFPRERRSTAMGIFWTSTAFGTATSLLLGGVIAANYGWRAAFFVAGVPGLILAVLIFLTVREPARERDLGGRADEPAPSPFQTLRFVCANPTVFHAFIGVGLASLAMSGVPVWAASFLVRTQGFTLPQAGLMAGLGVGLFGALGSLLGGPIGDRVVRRWGIQNLPVVPMTACVLACASGLVFALSGSLLVVALAFIVFEIVSRAFTAPAYAILVTGVEPRMRGVVVSSVQAVTNLIGYGVGPLVVGVVSDQVGGPHSLKFGIAAVMIFSLWSGLHFLAAWFAARRSQRFAGEAAA